MVRNLVHTGPITTPKSSLQVWNLSSRDTSKSCGDICRRINSHWASLVKDSEDVASFAVMRSHCLGYKSIEYRMRHQKLAPRKKSSATNTRFDDALLYTRICVTLPSLDSNASDKGSDENSDESSYRSLGKIPGPDKDNQQVAFFTKNKAGFRDSFDKLSENSSHFQQAHLISSRADDDLQSLCGFQPRSHQGQAPSTSSPSMEQQLRETSSRIEQYIPRHTPSLNPESATRSARSDGKRLREPEIWALEDGEDPQARQRSKGKRRIQTNPPLPHRQFSDEPASIPPFRKERNLIMSGSFLPILENHGRELGCLHMQPRCPNPSSISIVPMNHNFQVHSMPNGNRTAPLVGQWLH